MTVPNDPRSALHRALTGGLAATTAALCLLVGCSGGGDQKPSGSAPVSAEPPVASASTSALPTEPEPAPAGDPVGTGFAKVLKATDKANGCKDAEFEVSQYLQRGDTTLAGKPVPGRASGDKKPEFAASWLVQLRNGRSQIGFAGYDNIARRVARDRGLAHAKEHAPKLFATGDQWTLVWFDDQGLAYTRPTFDTTERVDIEHLAAAKAINPAEVALSSTPDGSLIVASHIGTNGDQLSVFLFAPSGQGKEARAIGLTKSGKKPHDPAVAADENGYSVAWLEEDNRIVAVRLDNNGDQKGPGAIVARPAEKRGRLELTAVAAGSLMTWVEGDKILARKLDVDAKPKGDIIVVGTGREPVVISSGDGAIVAMLTKVDDAADQLVAVRVSAEPKVSEQALRISDKPVQDPPSIALGGNRFAALWTEVMGPTISSKRALLRLVDASCLK